MDAKSFREVFSPDLVISPALVRAFPDLESLKVVRTSSRAGVNGLFFSLNGEKTFDDGRTNIPVFESPSDQLQVRAYSSDFPPSPVFIVVAQANSNPSLVDCDGAIGISVPPSHLAAAINIVCEACFRMGPWFNQKWKPFSIDCVKGDCEPPVDTSYVGSVHYKRGSNTLSRIQKFTNLPAVLCFSDGLRKPSAYFFKDSIRRPIFAFARHHEFAEDYILVPLPTHQNFGVESFQEFQSPIGLRKEIFWRGTTTGVVHNSSGKVLHFHTVVKRARALDIDPTLLRLIYSAFHRFNFVYYAQGKPWINAGFVSELPGFGNLERQRVERELSLEYGFQMALEGNDFASSLPWQLLNGVVVFVPHPRYESIFNYGLTDLYNCVMCERDFLDLANRYQMVISDTLLRERVQRAAVEYARRFAMEDYQNLVFELILKIYNNSMDCIS